MTNKLFPEKFLLHDKVAVVTGGAGLLGRSAVIALAQAGATVYVADKDKKASLSLQEKGRKNKLLIHTVSLDISHVSSITRCIASILEKEQGIDIWVNCAYPRTQDWGNKFEDISPESWRKNIDMHLNGYVFCCQQVAEQMKKQGQGSIINFGSIYGVVGPDFSIYDGTDMTLSAMYAAIKGGIINFTRYLSTYYGKYNVRANTICPGGIFDHQPQSFVKKYEKKTPLGRMGTPDDIAGAVVFFSSEASSYVTGQILLVDGGWTVW